MTAYWVGDEPLVPVLLSPVRDGRHVDLDGFAAVQAVLRAPTGAAYPADAQLVEDEDEGRVVSVLVPPHLSVAGLYFMELQLLGPDVEPPASRRHERFELSVVVQAFNGWHSLASARAEWEDAGELDDARLFTLLETSRIECAAYAPALDAGQLPPVNYREAQLVHARNRDNARRADPNGSAGGEDFSLSVFPLDWVVQQMLRPKRATRSLR